MITRTTARVLALMLGWTCAITTPPAHAAAPTTAPAGDAVTESLLQELDAAPVKPPSPNHSHIDRPRGYPAGLWRLFLAPLATAAALGIAGGILGVIVLLRREPMVALAMPQIVAAGAALGMRYEWPTLPPALAAAAGGLIFLVLSKRRGLASGTLPALYVAGLSISFLLIANHGGHVADLEHLFTGVDVAISDRQAMLAVPLLLGAGLGCAMLWRRWLLLAQAPAAAELARVRPARWDALFLALLTLVILLGTSMTGVVMVLAMLFLPAAAVLPWVKRVPQALVATPVLSLALLYAGWKLSNGMGWPLSRTIGGVGFAALALSHVAAAARR